MDNIGANLFRAIQLIGGEQLYKAVETLRNALDEAESRGYGQGHEAGFDAGWDVGYETANDAFAAQLADEVELVEVEAFDEAMEQPGRVNAQVEGQSADGFQYA